MNYYPYHIGDFRSGTVNMSRPSRWIYRDMLDVYYDTEQPLPLDLDVLCDMLGVETDDERRMVERLLRFKFQQTEYGYRHTRCDEEIAAYVLRAETAKANGKRGGRPRKATGTDKKPSGFQSGSDSEPGGIPGETGSEANQEPRTKNQEDPPHIPPKRGEGFDAAKIDLPDWIDRDDWRSWVADRKARKKPVTREGAKRQLQQLADYRAEGHPPAAVIANSIAGGYQGLFPPRPPPRAGPVSRAQRLTDWNDELRAVLAEDGRPTEKFMGTIDATD